MYFEGKRCAATTQLALVIVSRLACYWASEVVSTLQLWLANLYSKSCQSVVKTCDTRVDILLLRDTGTGEPWTCSRIDESLLELVFAQRGHQSASKGS